MPTKRGWAAVAAGLSLWIAARLIGSPDLHVLAAGILVLPVIAALYVRLAKVRLGIRRHISPSRVFAGSRTLVDITMENLGRTTTSFLMLEDAMPVSLGRPARLVVTGVPPRNKQTVSYGIVCRQRGRYRIGPLTIFVSDPFGLARVRLQTSGFSDLLVYPQIEHLDGRHLTSQGVGAGESTVRHLYRSAAEFYTMREYVTGDDLRRIHWPSVAKTGSLMIRQDETTRRSSVHAGFVLRLATADSAPAIVTKEGLLEALAGLGPSRARGTAGVMRSLRSGSLADTTLALVTSPPSPGDVATMTRIGSGFGRKVAVLAYPVSPRTVAPERAAEITARASAARASLQRAGWEVHLVSPEGRLSDTWQAFTTRKLQPAASSS